MKEAHIALYKELVCSLAKCSSDTRLKVGCLILKDGRIVSTGYNGQIAGMPHQPIMVDGHDVSTIHAELNAICFAAKTGIPIAGCELFVSHFPCQICFKHIIASGITKIYFVEDYKNVDNVFAQMGLIDIQKV